MLTPSDGYVRHKAYLDVLDAELWLAEDADGRLYFPLKVSCGCLGIDFDTSLDTIKADSRLAPGLRTIKLPTAGGPQPQQCLRKLEYTWWLSLLDPRRFREERRAKIAERQRILMEFAEAAMLGAGKLAEVTRWRERRQTPQARSAQADMRGPLEGTFHCLRCGAPHLLVIDGAGWHLHLGVEVE
ncbi:MAG TPA: phage antirepressor N-terminal domain-containing protein [Ktedonobacterales bacterium]|nr:phage antirepressor N-terminal domain-containing protein [Ktedonobacterales bacterium]